VPTTALSQEELVELFLKKAAERLRKPISFWRGISDAENPAILRTPSQRQSGSMWLRGATGFQHHRSCFPLWDSDTRSSLWPDIAVAR